MTNLLPTVSKITKTLLLFCWCFLSLSCSNESSSGYDMQDNGLTLMKQIVQPIKDNIKKDKELWGGNERDEELATYNQYTKTVKEQKKRIKEHPEDAQAYLDLVEALEGGEAYNPHTNNKSQGKAYREMTRWLTTAIKKHPDNKELYQKRANVNFRNEQWQKAEADYTYLISMNPDDGAALSARGRAYEKLGLKKEARQDFETYAQIQLGTAWEFHKRGLFYYSRGDFDLAELNFSKDIELDPKKGNGYIFRAEIYFIQNRYDDSIADYKKMIEIDSIASGFGQGRIGMNYYYQGKYKKAEEAFVEALKRDPYLVTVMDWYISRHQQGKSSKAALEYMAHQFSDEYLEGSLIHLFLDKIPPEELLNMKSELPSFIEDTDLSNSYFYLGQYYLLHDSPSKAKTMFEKSIQATKVRFMPGRIFSEKELARLKSVNSSESNKL
jgi:lipoprotein NlpI